MFPPYKAPKLFSQLLEFEKDYDRLEYVRSELVRMAEEGTLCVTDLYNQGGQYVTDMAGRAILGHDFSDGTHVKVDVPPALAAYKVKIKGLNGWQVSFKKGMKPATAIQRHYGENSEVVAYTGHKKIAATTLVPVIVETGTTEAELYLADAWLCLRQHGAHCKPCARTASQVRLWKCEEVRPTSKPTARALTPAEKRIAELEAKVETLTTPKKPAHKKKTSAKTVSASDLGVKA